MNTKTTILTLALALVLGLGIAPQAQGMNQKPFNAQATAELFAACKLDNHQEAFERAKKAIEQDADVNAKANDEWTPLHHACSKGHTEIATLLLAKGADVKAKDNYGWTALHKACGNGHTEIATLLLEKGADVKATDNDGWTPLHWTCVHGHTEVVRLLLAAPDINVNATDNDGSTPLHLACSGGSTEIVKLLLVAGAQIVQTDIDMAAGQELKDFVNWEKVRDGQQVDPQLIQQEIQRIAAQPARAIVALLRPGLARIVLCALKTYDQQHATHVFSAVIGAVVEYAQDVQYVDRQGKIFRHLDNPDFEAWRVAKLLVDHLLPYVSMHNLQRTASPQLKRELEKRVQGPWNGHIRQGQSQTNGLKLALAGGTSRDTGFVFDN